MSNALRVAHGRFGRVALLDMDAPLVRHAHPHCHVLIHAEGSNTQFVVHGHTVPLTRNSAVLVNAWEAHHYAHDPAQPRTIILALYIEPLWLGRFRHNWTASGAPGFFEQPCAALPPRLRRLADEMAHALANGAVSEAAQEMLVSKLMIAVIERFTPWRETRTSLRDAAGPGVDRRIRRAIAAIQQDPAAIPDVATLARHAGLSRAHFFRLFEQALHVPPRVFLNVLRLERAVQALVQTATPIGDIGSQLGFGAAPHFTRFFRDHAGASPSEFRAAAGRAPVNYETVR